VPASTTKKVVVVRFDRDPVLGFANPASFVQPDGLEILTADGTLLVIPLREAKLVCFVRDFDTPMSWREHRTFLVRPKMAGLWIRARFRDGDELEGMLPNDLLAPEPSGYTVVPPDPSFQNQKIFLPRSSLSRLEVLGVVGSPLRRSKAKKPKAKLPGQIEMFD
jgi:hypothetical protein